MEDKLKEFLSFFEEKNRSKQKPSKLLFDISSKNKIFVWAEIEDEEFEKVENALILAEAKFYSKYYNEGIYMKLLTVNTRENIEPPSYYNFISL